MNYSLCVVVSLLATVVVIDGQNCFEENFDNALNVSKEVYPSPSSTATPLYFGLMVAPSEDSDYLNSTVSAVQLALDTINTDPDLLRGYSLHYTLTTSQCTENDLVKKTLTQLSALTDQFKFGLIEAGCTAKPSFAHTHLTKIFNITEITCSPTVQDPSTSADSDTGNQYTVEVSPTNDVILPALVEIISYYIWTRLSLIIENKEEYSKMIKSLESLNVTLTVSTISVENHTLNVEGDCDNQLFDQNTRIVVFLVSTKELINLLLCEAYHAEIQYPKHEFIFVSDHHSDWWVGSPQNDSHYGCSTEQRAQVLNHSLALQWRPSHSTFPEELTLKLNVMDNRDALYCYDAVWALALALNKTVAGFSEGKVCTHRTWLQSFHQLIRENSFNGVSGRVEFERNGRRRGSITEVLIHQYQSQTYKNETMASLIPRQVGLYKNGCLSLIRSEIHWPSGIPYDGSPVPVLATVETSVTVVYYSIATAGIILTIACCIFNFSFRKTKIIRMTSPNLNYVIAVGTFFLFFSSYWYVLPSVNPNVVLTACCVQIWFFAVGEILVIGPIVAKVGRIYFIFRNSNSAKQRTITDGHLFLFILLLVIIVVFILVVYTTVEIGATGYELKRNRNEDHLSEVVGERGVNEHYEFYTCERVPYVRSVTAAVLYGIAFVLLTIALFMAFKTRKIEIKALNDAKFITAIACIVAPIHLITRFSFPNRVNLYNAIFVGFNMTTTTAVLLLVFLPKMISLCRDPKGSKVYNFTDAKSQVLSLSTTVTVTPECIGCRQLIQEVKTLKQNLEKEKLTHKQRHTPNTLNAGEEFNEVQVLKDKDSSSSNP